MAADHASTSPLAGIRVLEIANWVAAPSCAAMMADMGADVIKVEPPRGDGMRGRLRQPRVPEDAPAIDAPWHNDNRGKRSIAVDLDDPSGAALIRRIAASVDVVITNLLPQRQQRFGLTAEHLREDNPSLIFAVISGYGTRGPEAERIGFDTTAFFARGGVSGLLGDTSPAKPRPGQGDHVAALALLSGILAALRVRDAAGTGRDVEVSLLHSGIWTIGCDMATALADRRQPSRRTRSESVNPATEPYRCADGRWIQLSGVMEEHWEPFCTALGRPDLADDERFTTMRSRYEHNTELVELLDELFAGATRDEWGRRLEEAGLNWGYIAELPDVAEDPQARANDVFAPIEHPQSGPYEVLNAPFRVVGADVGVRGAAPEVGEQTDEVLVELGLDASEITALRESRTVGAAPREERTPRERSDRR